MIFNKAPENYNNCRCCKKMYNKADGFWQDTSIYIDGELKEPVGFCEFCDRNNKEWYSPNFKCHAK